MADTVTAADLVNRITYLDGTHLDVVPVLADRINARAVQRKLGNTEDNELRAYATAFTAAQRLGKATTIEDFAAQVIDVALYTHDGRPVRAVNGVLMADGLEVDPDPTQQGHRFAG